MSFEISKNENEVGELELADKMAREREWKQNSLYPERQSDAINNTLARLKKLERGEIKKLELSEKERMELKSLENNLGEKFEEIFKLNPVTEVFYLDYFLTDEGRKSLDEVTGIQFGGDSIEELNHLFIENREAFSNIDPKKRKRLVKEGIDFNKKTLLNEIEGTIDENGEINVEEIANPNKLSILVNPEEASSKIKQLRQFKKEIKGIYNDLEENSDYTNDFKKAIKIILKIYTKKINETIAEDYHLPAIVKNYENQLGENFELDENEESLLSLFPKTTQIESAFSQYDKFIHGASSEYNDGQREQISAELGKHADEVEKLFILNEVKKDENIRKKGLDPEKIRKVDFKAEHLANLAEILLDEYGEKSSEPASNYSPNRNKTASDDKWQFVVQDHFTYAAVEDKEKIIKCTSKDKSIFMAMTIYLGHEWGHFIQNINSSDIDLKIFDRIKGDRRSVLAEAGAMYFEDQVSKALFGVNKIPNPFYVRAMQKRLEGGSYVDCVKAFYDSNLKVLTEQKKAGVLDDDQFKNEITKAIRLAIDRTKRLFKGGSSLEDSSYLIKSKDTAYIEQRKLMNAMADQGMEKYAFVLGINLETLADLIELGEIDQNKIKEPNIDYILEIWNKIKDNYSIEA